MEIKSNIGKTLRIILAIAIIPVFLTSFLFIYNFWLNYNCDGVLYDESIEINGTIYHLEHIDDFPEDGNIGAVYFLNELDYDNTKLVNYKGSMFTTRRKKIASTKNDEFNSLYYSIPSGGSSAPYDEIYVKSDFLLPTLEDCSQIQNVILYNSKSYSDIGFVDTEDIDSVIKNINDYNSRAIYQKYPTSKYGIYDKLIIEFSNSPVHIEVWIDWNNEQQKHQ